MCPTSTESIDQSAELTFTRDASRPGYVHVEAAIFESIDHTVMWPLGTYRLRDLLIALHAVQVDGVAVPPFEPPAQPRKRRWFG